MLEKALINSTIDSVILKLKENDRITGEEIEQLQKSFDSQNLVIGVVGKMKAGNHLLLMRSFLQTTPCPLVLNQ